MKICLSVVVLVVLWSYLVHAASIYPLYNNALEIDENENVTSRIAGGSDVAIGEYPYQVSLRHAGDNSYFCGGTIIASRWVLTAAQCVFGLETSLIIVVAGSNTLNTGGTAYGVDRIVLQPDYSPTRSPKSNIALLMINYGILYNSRVRAIGLARSSPVVGTIATAIGWGFTTFPSATPSNSLKQVDLEIVDNDRCKRFWPQATDDILCTFKAVLKGTCVGDIGGPLLANNKLVGVISYGYACGIGAPDVSTNVALFYPWIQSITGIGSDN